MSNIVIQYSVSGSTPLTVDTYVFGVNSNPKVINSSEQLTLQFKADGIYFQLVPTKSQVKITNATLASWTCKSPYSEATLEIKDVVDVSADVVITIPTKVKIAPQLVTKPFLTQITAPLDTRLVLSKKEMLEIKDNYQPDVYFALCKDDGHFYLYNKNVSKNDETGKFTIITDSIQKTLITIDGGEILPK